MSDGSLIQQLIIYSISGIRVGRCSIVHARSNALMVDAVSGMYPFSDQLQ